MLVPRTTAASREVRASVALLPVGSFEQHGSHLPLATDTLVAGAIVDAIRRYHPAFILPPLTFSCSHEHNGFPGTVSISATTLASLVSDIASSIARQGIRALLIVNGHGGNYVLANCVQELNAHGPIRAGLYPAREDWAEARKAAGIASSSHEDMHAGELETSIVLASSPDYVRDGWEAADHLADDRRYLTTLGIGAYTDSGVIGRPSLATVDKGHTVLSYLGQSAGRLINLVTAEAD